MVQAKLAALRSGLLALLLAASLFTGCDTAGGAAGGDVVGGVDLDALFAPAQPSEIQQASEAWTGREAPARGVDLVLEDHLTHDFAPDWQAELRVYGHEVDGYVHFGAVIAPAGETETPQPVLLYLHGGDAGVRIADVALALAVTPVMRDDYVVVIPSFRSEPLHVDGVTYRSEGPASPWDRDVDDTIGLLNVALLTIPSADAERIVALGFSRGAAVGLLVAARDPRIVGVASFFGPTDFLGPFARAVTREMLLDDGPNLPGISHLDETLLGPLQEGQLTIDEVRVDLIRRSPVYFADRLPAVQIHHGVDDPIVPPTEAQALADALEAAGRTDVETYLYPGGGHDPFTLNGAFERLKTFLRRWTNQPELSTYAPSETAESGAR